MRALSVLALSALAVFGQTGMRDRYFARYPFDQWLNEPDRAQIKWEARVYPAKLSAHQRLAARIEIFLDAREVGKRRGRGEFVTLLRVEDSAGKIWRAHNGYDLSLIPADAKAVPLMYAQDVFLLPGDYKIAMATCDSITREYSFTRRTLHVGELKADALAQSDRDLPAVEFVRPLDAPDSWFQPYIRGRLRVGVPTTRPVHVDLVMNITPSERASGSLRIFRRNMSVLVPALKILAGMEVPNGSLDVTLLDLTRQKTWEQIGARGLDWKKMREPLADAQPGVIDAQSLAAKAGMARFFRDQVLVRATAARDRDELSIVIVLSAPAFLDRQLRLEPAALERDPNRRIFYLRYRPVFLHPVADGSVAAPPLPSDDLEHALKTLDARVLTASSREEFRKAVAAMLSDIGKM
jgi:hypothetical protein